MAPISGNRPPGHELSVLERGIAIGLYQGGMGPTKVAKALSIHRNTVYKTVALHATRDQQKSLPRSGRPKKYNPRDERMILRLARQNPKYTYQRLEAELNLGLSQDTYYRILKHHNIKNWMARSRPQLTDGHAQKRLEWALKY